MDPSQLSGVLLGPRALSTNNPGSRARPRFRWSPPSSRRPNLAVADKRKKRRESLLPALARIDISV